MSENIQVVNEAQRIIHLNTHVNEESAAAVVAAIIKLSSQSDEDIDLYITSGGGSILSGLAIIDAIRLSNCHICGVVVGFAASMASVIACSCDETLMTENAYFMLHQASSACEGKVSDMEEDLAFTKRLNEHTDTLISKATGISMKKLKEICKKDAWFNAEESVALGLANGILKSNKNIKDKLKRKKAREEEKAQKLLGKKLKEIKKSTKVEDKTDDNKE